MGGAPPPPPTTTEDEVDDLRGETISIAPSAEVGTLPGSSSVDRFGQANYRIPIDVSPGPRGMQPHLALTYNSGGGNGPLGMGFGLAGLSQITRCPRTLLIDGAYEPVNWTNNDAICLDGERLVLYSGTYGTDGSEYRTRHDSFTKVVLHGTLSDELGWFDVYRKDHRIQTYGRSAGWRVENGSLPLSWALETERDRFDNTVYYSYDTPIGPSGEAEQIRIVEIRYGGTGSANSQRVVEFQYGTGDGTGSDSDRPDVGRGFFYGYATRQDRLLESIVARGPGNAVLSEYNIAYGHDGITHRRRIESVQRCDRFGRCMPATTFEWEDGGTAGFGNEALGLGSSSSSDPYTSAFRELVGSRQTLVGDFDGDFKHSLMYLQDDGGSPTWHILSPHEPDDDLANVVVLGGVDSLRVKKNETKLLEV